MPSPGTTMLPPPTSDQEFEQIALDALRIIWNAPGAELHGKRGQRQHGVDIFYCEAGPHATCLVAQCKNTKTLSTETIEHEASLAEAFVPRPTNFYLAWSGSRDARLQQWVRERGRALAGRLPVKLVFWPDIWDALVQDPKLIGKHWTGWSEVLLDEPHGRAPEEGLPERCRELLDIQPPPSLYSLFPQAGAEVDAALAAVAGAPRVLSGSAQEHEGARLISVDDLPTLQSRRHLILAPGGAGKTFALWNAAKRWVERGSNAIFIDLRAHASSASVFDLLETSLGAASASAALNNSRTIFVLDEWPQFPRGNPESGEIERTKLLLRLNATRVIAAGRLETAHDARFQRWELQLLPLPVIRSALKAANRQEPAESVMQLLRLPLALVLYLLTRSEASNCGGLLRELHLWLSRGEPAVPDLLSAIAQAAAGVHRRRTTSRQTFDVEFSAACRSVGLQPAPDVIARLGTLGQDRTAIRPVHDLYWSFLVGVGLLRTGMEKSDFVRARVLREAMALAVDAGEESNPRTLELALETDLATAAVLLRETGEHNRDSYRRRLCEKVNQKLQASVPAHALRAIEAALVTSDTRLLHNALKRACDLESAGYIVSSAVKRVDVERLQALRNDLQDLWATGVGNALLEAIAERGGRDWDAVLERATKDAPQISHRFVGAALACSERIPNWCFDHLRHLCIEHPWRLRFVAQRGQNDEFAQWLATNYSDLVDAGGKNGSRWLHLNPVLIGCGGPHVWSTILDRFFEMSESAQSQVLWAVAELPSAQVARFQEYVFSRGFSDKWYKLHERICPQETSLGTIESWISSPVEKLQLLGWRTFVGKVGNKAIPRIISSLPVSFDGATYLAPLEAMSGLAEYPNDVVDELWNRLRGKLEPRLTSDLVEALCASTFGVARLVRSLVDRPDWLPMFHLGVFLEQYQKWRRRTGLQIHVGVKDKKIRFEDWIAIHRVKGNLQDDFLDKVVSAVNSPFLGDMLAARFLAEPRAVTSLLSNVLVPLDPSSVLVQVLAESGDSAAIGVLLRRCKDALGEVSEKVLLRVLEFAIGDRNRENLHLLISWIALSPNIGHDELHRRLVQVVLSEEPTAQPALYSSIAQTLCVHSEEVVRNMLDSLQCEHTHRLVWLIGEIERVGGGLLVDTDGRWISLLKDAGACPPNTRVQRTRSARR